MISVIGASAIREGPRASARLGCFGRLAPRAPRRLGQPCCFCGQQLQQQLGTAACVVQQLPSAELGLWWMPSLKFTAVLL